MFAWEYCHGCDEFDREDGKECEYAGKHWECPYADAVQEDIDREEDF